MRRLTIHRSDTGPTQFLDGTQIWGEVAPGTVEDGVGPAGPAPRLIVRSERAVTDAESAFAAWSDAGWRAFDAAVTELLEQNKSPLLLWPGPGSVLSDAVSTLSFARRQPRVGLVIDPVAWITPAMAPDAEDHLARFAQALLACPAVACVVVRACEPGGMDAATVAKTLQPLAEHAGHVAAIEADLARI